jgi:hypothetical protein
VCDHGMRSALSMLLAGSALRKPVAGATWRVNTSSCEWITMLLFFHRMFVPQFV